MAQTWAVLAALLFLLIGLVEGQAYNMVNVEVGHEAVLSCPYTSKEPLLMVIWKMKCSTCCLLAYRSDHNKTKKLNCSERMMWRYSPDSDPALRIYPVNLDDEGNYTCEVVSRAGNFLFFSSLTVTVPPTVTLTCDNSRGVVCRASAGKPAADISWVSASSHSTEEEVHHPNGTVTRVSYIAWVNSTHPTVTCLVTHPATNQTLSLDLSHTSPRIPYLLIAGPASVAAVSGVTLCLIFTRRVFQVPKLARGSAAPLATKNFRSTPSRVKTAVVKPPVLSEIIYQNYDPTMINMNYATV
ncbi:cell surface glycoprotein CD200 receptor 1-B-like isoform X1 [Falco peregrinus]|uniref:cell surface glycoprotein CD200 receptor 1-B-like isoform X1 n=1 Tax=Falco peregrinus TaxID=8954 RepID=UPI00247A743F|nr:cell surface glycoprotein CD200 receptor 1-B-like isoform X1 [Falco peregrinus]